jgi:hypothetical protein
MSMIRAALAVLLVPSLLAGSAGAGALVTVRVTSGRSFTAEVDARSSAERLWLRWSRHSTVVLRPVDYDAIAGVSVGDVRLTADEFRTNIQQYKSQVAASDARRDTDPTRRSAAGNTRTTDGDSPTDAQRARELLRVADADRRVTTVQVVAHVANWDADVEPDGILLHVYPQTRTGAVVSVDGVVDVSLIAAAGERVATDGRPAATSKLHFPTIGRWTRRIRPGDLRLDGVMFKLPFGAIHPDFRDGLDALGAVHVKLTVPGAGVFETTADAVRLKSVGTLRDTYERQSGTRFFPIERRGRSK